MAFSPKAINYILFKDNFEFENYFNILEDKDIYMYTLYNVYTMYISNHNHKLPIETGRWYMVSTEKIERVKNVIADLVFTENRTQLISRYQ